MDVVTTAIMFHDIGKVYDYTRFHDGHYEYTEHKELIRHLPRSYATFMSRTDPAVSEELRTKIGHCILAHHGRMEWGSPVTPLTPEAYVVHCADWISADATVDYWE
jgi:3'-5' exoribonuclease